VEDLEKDGARLRRDIPRILDGLVADAKLIRLTTSTACKRGRAANGKRVSSESTALSGDLAGINNKRAAQLNGECLKTLAVSEWCMD